MMNEGQFEDDYFEKLISKMNNNELLSPFDQNVIALGESYQSMVYSEFSEYFMLMGKSNFTAKDVDQVIDQMEDNFYSYQYKTDPGWEECIKECSRKTASCKFDVYSSWWAGVVGAGIAGGIFTGGSGILPGAAAGAVSGAVVLGDDYIRCLRDDGTCKRDCPQPK
jgi:hypothetical protein